MADAPPVFTVRDAMIACGIDDDVQWNGQTKAERFAEDVFGNEFAATMDKTMEDLRSDFKSYSD